MADGTEISKHEGDIKNLMERSDRQDLTFHEILQKLSALDTKYDQLSPVFIMKEVRDPKIDTCELRRLVNHSILEYVEPFK